ncbi:MAG: DUF1131 family protein [Gammaproteobacteria bacterium]|nr:DUF1131 family protein [Gammaproteobacteria bacterium]MCP5458076.1 DUF1131 family protein [Gammaproteobacteria bacterium]
MSGIQPALAASFDCAKAQSKIEKVLCGDDELNQADSELDELYFGLRKSLSKAAAEQLKKDQLNWLKERERCARDSNISACLRRVYSERITALHALEASGKAGQDTLATLVLTSKGLGKLNRDTILSHDLLERELPGYSVRELTAAGNEREARFEVYRQDKLVLALYPDSTSGKVTRIIIDDNNVVGPGGVKLGTPFETVSQQSQGQLLDCEAGADELRGLVVCWFARTSTVRYAFEPVDWTGPVGDLPPRSVLRQARVVKMLWVGEE